MEKPKALNLLKKYWSNISIFYKIIFVLIIFIFFLMFLPSRNPYKANLISTIIGIIITVGIINIFLNKWRNKEWKGIENKIFEDLHFNISLFLGELCLYSGYHLRPELSDPNYINEIIHKLDSVITIDWDSIEEIMRAVGMNKEKLNSLIGDWKLFLEPKLLESLLQLRMNCEALYICIGEGSFLRKEIDFNNPNEAETGIIRDWEKGYTEKFASIVNSIKVLHDYIHNDNIIRTL